MPELFAGLGVFGLATALALASLLCLVQPIWALVDCVESDRERDAKVLVSVAILFTWGLGSFVYGLFFAQSSHLRRFTLVSSLIAGLLGVIGFASCVSAIATQARRASEQSAIDRADARRRVAEFAPAPIAADAVAPFRALHIVATGRHSETTALCDFTLAGPVLNSAVDVRGGIRHVAWDAELGRTFALTQHGFGAISPTTGEFIEIAVDPSLDFSWPKGLAWDPEAGKVIVMTSHVFTEFFAYDPSASSWEKLPTSIRDLSLSGLAYVPVEGLLYAMGEPKEGAELDRLQRFNGSGAHVGLLALSPPIPLGDAGDVQRAQIHHSSGSLVVVLPPYESDDAGAPNRVYRIDPASGRVFAHAMMTIAVERENGPGLAATELTEAR